MKPIVCERCKTIIYNRYIGSLGYLFRRFEDRQTSVIVETNDRNQPIFYCSEECCKSHRNKQYKRNRKYPK